MGLKLEKNPHSVSLEANLGDHGTRLSAGTTSKGVSFIKRPHVGVSLGTGIAAIASLVALVAFAILFSPAEIAFMVMVPIAAVLLLGLGVTASIYAVKASQAGKNVLNVSHH